MLIVPISALIGWWIYWYKNDYPDWAMSLRAAVSAARFGVLLIIGLMLLEPFLISMLNDVEKPSFCFIKMFPIPWIPRQVKH